MYGGFENFYNREMPVKYYRDTAVFFDRMMKKYARPYYTENNIVLDCGCGTGILTDLLAQKGYDMIGLDVSSAMLDKARENCDGSGKNILWLCQDMTKMDLYGTVAGIICATDTVNHLTTEKKLDKFFSLASNYVEPGGIFVFDVLTEEYFKEKIDGNVFFVDEDEYTCIWHGRYSEKSRICKYEITSFEKENENYFRNDVSVRERFYGMEEITERLENAGFENIKTFGGTSFEKVDKNRGRIYFVAAKPKIKLKK